MKTAALLQLPGNPFALWYWLRNREQVWAAEADEFHVFLNGARNAEALAECHRMVVEAGGIWHDPVPNRLSHGYACQVLFNDSDAEALMLIEDDAFVRVPGSVAWALEMAKDGYITGSPRGGMSPKLEEYARWKWGTDPVGPDGSSGYGLWPCFLFAQREQLAPVWYGFPAQEWPVGSTIPGIDYFCNVDGPMHTDTFTASAYALRASAGHKLVYEGQWKELWLRNLDEMRERAGYDPPWFHAGGLANEDFFNGGYALDNARPDIGGTMEGKDWAHRIWWIRRIVNACPDNLLPDLQALYQARLDQLTDEMGVHTEVSEWGTEEDWVNWDDGTP